LTIEDEVVLRLQQDSVWPFDIHNSDFLSCLYASPLLDSPMGPVASRDIDPNILSLAQAFVTTDPHGAAIDFHGNERPVVLPGDDKVGLLSSPPSHVFSGLETVNSTNISNALYSTVHFGDVASAQDSDEGILLKLSEESEKSDQSITPSTKPYVPL